MYWNMYLLQAQLLLVLISTVQPHIVGDKAHLTELKKLCEHAYICFHDNIIICGKSVNEARTFLDLCDLYEYSCEYNMDEVRLREIKAIETIRVSRVSKCSLPSNKEIQKTARVFRHVKEEEGVCPNAKELNRGVG